METYNIKIGGMSCENCVGHVSKALAGLPGTQSIQVNLSDGSAVLDIDPHLVTVEQLLKAIDDEGYSASILAAD